MDMGIGIQGRAAACISLGLLAGCGGGGGGSNTVSLKTAADVRREIANVVTLYDSGASATVAAHSVSGKALARAAAMRAQVVRGGATKAETVGCDSGSYAVDDFTNVTRDLPLFGASPNVDYGYYDYNQCYNIEGLYAFTTDGYHEFGDNNAYAASSAENPYYAYQAWGSGSSSLVSKVESAPGFADAGTSTERARGRLEYRDNGTTAESREIVDFTLRVRAGDISDDIELGGGETGNPLVIADHYVAGNVTIDGPFFYGTAGECSGGRLDYDTVEPMVFAEDGNGVYVNDGSLAISSGSVTVTLTFQPDGDVSYALSTGETGEVTRAELANTPPCGVFI